MYNVRSSSRSDKVIEVSYEGNDWVRVIGNTKVRPASVVELFHCTSCLGPSPRDLERPYGVVGQLHNIHWIDGDILQGQSTIGQLRPIRMAFCL